MVNLEIQASAPQVTGSREIGMVVTLVNHADTPMVNFCARFRSVDSLVILSPQDVRIPQIKPGQPHAINLRFQYKTGGKVQIRLEKINYRLAGMVETPPDCLFILDLPATEGVSAESIQLICNLPCTLRQNENGQVELEIRNESDLPWQETWLNLHAEGLGLQTENFQGGSVSAHSVKKIILNVHPGQSGTINLNVDLTVITSTNQVTRGAHFVLPIQRDDRDNSTVVHDSVITGSGVTIGSHLTSSSISVNRSGEVKADNGGVISSRVNVPGVQPKATCPYCGQDVSGKYCDHCGRQIEVSERNPGI